MKRASKSWLSGGKRALGKGETAGWLGMELRDGGEGWKRARGPPVLLSPDPGELSSGEAEELQQIKWHRKQLLEDIQVCSHSAYNTHAFVHTCVHALEPHPHMSKHSYLLLTQPGPRAGLDSSPLRALALALRSGKDRIHKGTPHSWLSFQGPGRAKRAGQRKGAID